MSLFKAMKKTLAGLFFVSAVACDPTNTSEQKTAISQDTIPPTMESITDLQSLRGLKDTFEEGIEDLKSLKGLKEKIGPTTNLPTP